MFPPAAALLSVAAVALGGPSDTAGPEAAWLAGSHHPWVSREGSEAIGSASAAGYRLRARAYYLEGDYPSAARYFAAAARSASGVRRGVLETWAADAWERAGRRRAAVAHYRAALRLLPEVAPWIAVRLARVAPDQAVAFEVLERASGPAAPLAAEVRAAWLRRGGALREAAVELWRVGRYGSAASLALEARDQAAARRWGWAALSLSDTAETAAALEVLWRVLRGAEAHVAVGRSLERRGQFTQAAAWFARAAILGDRSPSTLLALGRVREGAGDVRGALAVFAEAREAGAGVPEGAEAYFRWARLAARVGRREGVRALQAFPRRYPQHPLVPQALATLAELEDRTGAAKRADSLDQLIVRHWPGSPAASEARWRLAQRAQARGARVLARSWYQAVVQDGGPNALAARYLLARMAREEGDSLQAWAGFAALARDDPLGYYGTAARVAAGLGMPVRAAARPVTAPERVRRLVATLNLLDAVGFRAEAERLVAEILRDSTYAADELLALATGLVARGRPSAASALGWRAAGRLGLEDARVLSVIFPWPWRSLIEAEAGEFGLDPYLVAAVIRQESGFRPDAVSRSGARGLMQLMPPTAALTASRLGLPWREPWLADPAANLHIGAAYLAMLLRRYRGSVERALAAYNAGARPVERWVRRPEANDPFWFVERIPYPETKRYVRAVLRNRVWYQALYPPAESP